jgi:CheY-like chemotaxis protein
MSHRYFDFLNKTITVLVVDDEPCHLDFYEDFISGHPIYKIIKAPNAQTAENAIHSGVPIHICILDFGIDDINNDECYLLKKYSRQIPFVVISGSADIERAFEASKLGAAGLLAKPVDVTSPVFWDKLSEIFLQKTILPDLSAAVNPIICECCRVLVEDTPEMVSEWATKSNITDAYLRRLWSECFTFSPKHVLFLYKAYKSAFSYLNAQYLSEINNVAHVQKIDTSAYHRLESYYLQNRKTLETVRDKKQDKLLTRQN